MADARGKIIYTNPALERMLGTRLDGEHGTLCERLCDRLAHGPDAPSRTCPLLDGGAKELRASWEGLYGSAKRYRWSVDGTLVPAEPPYLHADCLRLGEYGSDWDGLHVMRVERFAPSQPAVPDDGRREP